MKQNQRLKVCETKVHTRSQLCKCNKISIEGRNRRGDRCDHYRTYIFRCLNPISTKGADSAQHHKGRTQNFPVVTSLALHHIYVGATEGWWSMFVDWRSQLPKDSNPAATVFSFVS